MASKKLFYARANNYIYPSPVSDNSVSSDHTLFELDESEVWNSSVPVSSSLETTTNKKMVPNSRTSSKKISRKMEMPLDRTSSATPLTCAASLPLSIPDWSKIYRQEDQKKFMHGSYLDHDQENSGDYDDDDHGGVDQDYRVPPHEFLARRRGASFSVHEGIGRTLKGRDLRQVRNAIWKKVGFED